MREPEHGRLEIDVAPGEPVLDWHHDARVATERGQSGERAARTDELERMSVVLDVVAVRRLTARYALHAEGVDDVAIRLKGRVVAEIVQSCVVTLEPVVQVIDEPFNVVFEPARSGAASETVDFDPLSEEDIEPLIGTSIEVGRIVYETVAAAIDPYPRRPEASLASGPEVSDDDSGNRPFADLRRRLARPEPELDD